VPLKSQVRPSLAQKSQKSTMCGTPNQSLVA
jgi:hypothetical protein